LAPSDKNKSGREKNKSGRSAQAMSNGEQLAGAGGENGPYERILFGGVSPGVTNFGIGAPDDSILKNLKEATLQAAQHRFAQDQSHLLLQYGPTRGDGEFVESLATFLQAEYKDSVKREELMLTSGASQGLQMAATFFFNAGDTVFIENPTYFLALEMFKDLRLNLVPIPQDEEGMQVDLLEKALEERELTGGKTDKFKAMVYTVPTYNNPTSVTLSDARRQKLVDLAYKHKLLVVSDDVYTMLHFTSSDSALRPPPRLGKAVVMSKCSAAISSSLNMRTILHAYNSGYSAFDSIHSTILSLYPSHLRQGRGAGAEQQFLHQDIRPRYHIHFSLLHHTHSSSVSTAHTLAYCIIPTHRL
jgi:DNA-binding transcriptional MocR family regulator